MTPVFVLGTVCALAPALVLAQPKPVYVPKPTWLALRDALKRHDFEPLTKTLDDAQAAFEKSVLAEGGARDPYYAFNVADPSLESLLGAWVQASPRSPAPLAARAQYFEAMGRAERGRAWAADTSDAKMRAMTRHLERAKADCRAALRLRPRLLVCRVLLIDILKRDGPAREAWANAAAAIKEDPASFLLRQAYMHSLTPRWGGSHDAMQRLATESQAEAASNPRLTQLLGYVAWDRGNMMVATGHPAESLPFFTEALKSGEDPLFLSDRAGAYYRLEDYTHAVTDLARVLNAYHEGWSYSIVLLQTAFLYQAASFRRIGFQAGVLPYFGRAEEVDPFDPEVVDWREIMKATVKPVP